MAAEADGSVVINVDMDAKEAEHELARLKREILKMEESIAKSKGMKAYWEQQADSIAKAMDEAWAKFEEMQRTGADESALKAQGEKLDALNAEWQAATANVEKYNDAIQRAELELDVVKSHAGELAAESILGYKSMDIWSDKVEKFGATSREALKSSGRAIEEVSGKVDKLGRRLGGLAKRVFVFSLITSALRSMREWLGKAVKSNAEASAAIAKLQGALLTLVQPLLSVVIPAFVTFVNLLTRVVGTIASVVSSLFGTTAEASAEAAEALYDEQNALEGVGGAAKKAGKSLAGFDTIQKLSGEDAGGAGGAISDKDKPDFMGFLGGELDKIATLLGGALLAVGAILTFTGANIPLGLGLMAVGAAILGSEIAANWNAISEALQGPLGALVALLSGALLVLGAILLFTGANIPLGLGLVIAGGAGLAATVAANWDTIKALLQGPLGVVLAIISGALLVLGAILLFSGAHIPLGIGLMVAGAAGLAMSVAANWDTVKELLQGPLGAITGILSTAFLVLGAIFTFTGANIPLGIGLLLLGAAGLATTVAVNWDSIKETLQGPIGTITAMLSVAFLVLGAILLFSGAAAPLGLGLIAVGAVGLAATIAANWGTIQTTMGSTIDAIVGIVSGALLVLGAILIFTGANIPLGLGMLIAGGAGLAATVAPRWDFVQEKLAEAWDGVKAWWDSNVAQYLTWEYWQEKGSGMMDALVNGLLGGVDKIGEWTGNILDKAKGLLGIHSPSAEYDEMGEYSGLGYYNGIQRVTPMIIAAFDDMLQLIKGNTKLTVMEIQELFADLMLYLTKDFYGQWYAFWLKAYSTAKMNIRATMTEIDALNAKLASIERNIVITITTVYKTEGEPSGGVSGAVARAPAASGGRTATPAAVSTFSAGEDVGNTMAARTMSARTAVASVPAIAQGMVTPSNREFMDAAYSRASTGGNSDAQTATIVQAIKEAMSGGTGFQKRNLTATFVINGREAGHIATELYDQEENRIGLKLSKG